MAVGYVAVREVLAQEDGLFGNTRKDAAKLFNFRAKSEADRRRSELYYMRAGPNSESAAMAP